MTNTDTKPWLIMLVGLPNSGKSTWIQREFFPYLAEATIYADLLSTDDIVEHCASVTRKSYIDVFKEIINHATKVIDARMYLSSFMGINIVLDQTNLTVKSRKHKLSNIKDLNAYTKIAVVFEEPLEVLLERNAARTGKVLDTKLIEEMHNRYEPVNALEAFDEVLTYKEFKLKFMPKVTKDEFTDVESGKEQN